MVDTNVDFDVSDVKRWTAFKLVSLVAVLGVLYYLRPVFHGIVYYARYYPPATIVVGGTALLFVVLYLLPPFESSRNSSGTEGKLFVLGSGFVILLVLGLIVGVVGGMFASVAHADQTMERADTVETLPSVDAENPRVAPKEVADQQTSGSVSYRQYHLGESDIVRSPDGSLAWSYAAEPEGFRNSIMEQQDGVVLSDMTEMSDRDITTTRTDMRYGEGMTVGPSEDGFVENRDVRWQLIKSDFWASYSDDARPFIHDGEPYMYYPKTGHNVHLTPVPHTTVDWKGGALVHPDGEIEHMTPEEARDNEILEGQALYPYHNTQVRLSDIGYRNGLWNAWFVHEDQVERADLPAGAGNSQPFVVDLNDGPMTYITAMEPYGQDTRALDEVWFTDSRTGEFTVYESNDDTLIGPERAAGIARGTDTRTDWVADGDDGQFKVVEPVPVVIDEELWWHMKVVPADGTDVTRNVFVHASSNDGRTAELFTTDSVVEFIEGEDVDDIDDADLVDEDGNPIEDDGDADTESPEQEIDNADYVVVVRDENGDPVEVVVVEDGENVDIELPGGLDSEVIELAE